MNTSYFTRLLVAFVCAPFLLATLSGCVAHQAITLRHAPGSGPAVASAKSVSIDAKDSREFIVSGNKQPSYLGHFRAGFGNTWDVNNAGKRALADQFRHDLTAELESHGVKVIASGERKMLVDIKDWNFDAYQNGKVWYEIAVSVAAADGTLLASIILKKENIVIRGSVMTGPAGAFKRDMPLLYSGIIKEILGNSEIQQALK